MSISIANLTPLGGAPATTDLFAVVDVSDTTQAPTGTTKNMTVANLFTSPAIAAPTLASPVVTGTLTVTGATVTASAPVLAVTQTWNNAAIAFTALRLNVTNTASDAASMLVDLQVGGVTFVKVDRTGLLTAQAITSGGVNTLGSVLLNGTGASFAAGKMYLNATNGLTLTTKTGSANDFTLQDPVGGIVVQMPTGTKNLETEGNLTVGKTAAKNLVVAAGGSALALNATVGFLFVSSMAGSPSGTPASIPTGTVPHVVDTSAGRAYWYYGAAWHFAALT